MKPTADKPESKTKSKPNPQADAKNELKSLPMEEVEKKLGSSKDGLSDAEAKKRLAQDGPNEIPEKKENLFLKFLTYFWGPIPWMIEAAVILSALFGTGLISSSFSYCSFRTPLLGFGKNIRLATP